MRRISGRALVIGLSVALVTSLAGQSVAAPSTVEGVPHDPQQERAVAVQAVPVKRGEPDAASKAALRHTPPVAWPVPRVSDVRLAGPAASVRATGLPVRVGSVPGSARAGQPGSVRVQMLGRAEAAQAGVDGVILRVRRSDGVAKPGPVSLTVDYGGFRHAYGGNWSGRLRMVRLAGNAAVPSHNDPETGTVTAQVEVSGADEAYAVTAGPSGSGGDYTATSLALTSTWQVSTQTGDFSWRYPLRMPQTPGGLAPELAISYSSGAVDGRTASTNNQPSWAGEGFDLWSGYIERSYKGCGDDLGGNQGQTKTGDQCWFSHNATMSLAGHSGQLVRDDATGVWRLKNDDGTRIELLTGAANGDNDGEYWKITTLDGTQYFFGLNRLPGWVAGKPETQSAWQSPVFGNHAGEPCHAVAYANSWCQQTYKWNLDYVVDRRGNSLAYYYAKDRNSYGLNLGKQTVAYDRGGVLLRAEFGTRQGSEYSGTAPASVVFGTADRCIPGANCASHTPQSYPDVPYDQECSANCTTLVSPTFWTTRRLASITTQIGTTAVEKWTLSHSFPAPGDGSSAALWLTGINHSGVYQGNVAMPAVTFGGLAMPNRVNSAADGLPPMNKYRIVSVRNEFGGVIGVNYAPANCTAGALPAPESNTLRCFPVYWQPDGGQAFTDWMHKYVVASLVQVDQVGGSPTEVTTYDYQGGGAWHYTDNELINPERRTWSEWRGYQKVSVLHGEASGVRSRTDYLYFRGMNGDRLPGGGVRSVSIVDSQGGSVPDENQYNGAVREKITYNGAGGPMLGITVNDVWQRGPTATQGSLKAFMVETGAVHERIATPGGWRRTQINRSYNNDALVTQIDDHGDLAVPGDEECTRTWYTQTNLLSRVEAVAKSCAATPSYPDDTISDVRNTYDAVGNPTKVEQANGYSGGQPVYVTATRTTFDAYGRPLDSYDVLDRKTTTAYTETAGLTTKMTITNALGHQTVTELTPAWGEPVTSFDANGRRVDARYDALGRVTGVWLPGRSEPAGEGPNLRYRYLIRNDGPSAVSTDTLRANGNYVTNHALYDGFLRSRQTQSPAWGGGRVITDTIYDSRGRKVKDNGKYYAEGDPGTTLVAAGDNNIPSQTVTEYDGAGRAIASIFKSLGVEQWRSSTAYRGDRIEHTPPAGGTATTVHLDADGRTTALHQHHGAQPTGPADVTRYGYHKTGQLATITDPAGIQWRYEYDLRGRRVGTHDPDKGHTASAYDVAGQMLTATDARGKTVAFVYDQLGRKTEERDGSPTGTLLAKWVYDRLWNGTVVKGLLGSSTRVDGGNAYTTAVLGYDAANRPTGTRVTIPAAEAGLAGTYQTNVTYRPDGSIASMALPRAGNLAAETVTYEYDDLGLAKKTSGASTYVNDTWYTRFGELSQLAMGGTGMRVWNTIYYDVPTRRLARSLVEREKTTGSQVNDFRYQYDPAGNLTQLADVPEAGPQDRQCFNHDYLRRMTEAWTTGATCPAAPSAGAAGGSNPYWTSYRYDLTGNRTGDTSHGLGGAADTTRSYEYAAASHALNRVTTTGPSGSTLDTYRYDATGNTIERNLAGSAQSLEWDVSGRLSLARSAGGQTTTLTYDADGNRLLRRDPVATTLYLGAQEIRHDRTTGVTTGTRYYSHGGSAVGVRNGTGLYWQAGDHHSTVTTSVRADTLAVTRRQFTPFGDVRGTPPGSWHDEHSFVGGTRDESLGLIQLGAREYDPKNGRFISVDPIIDPNDPQQLNGYSYANNSPATYSDPDGLFPSCGCPSDRYGYDNVLHNADGTLLSESDANKYLNSQQKAKWAKKAQRKAQRDQERANWERKVKASGHSKEEYEEAKKIKQKSVLDVVIEAGGDVLMEFLGINDIKGCFGEGDLGSCIAMVINIIPWSKVFKIGSLIGAVKKAWNAVMNFRDKQKWADNVVKKIDACNSFAPGTLVLLADGRAKPIEAVEIGDVVVAHDPETGEVGAKVVAATIIGHGGKNLVAVTVGKDVIVATDNHPFWVPDLREWIPATDLKVGSWLQTSAGTWVQVTAIERWTQTTTVHNLTVTGIHTYFVLVGDTPVLVHNVRGGGLRPDYSAEGPHSTFKRDGTTGQVKKWATWTPQTNPRNPAPWEMVERFDLRGPAHVNKNGDVIPTPHINTPGGDARTAQPWEIPGSGASCPLS